MSRFPRETSILSSVAALILIIGCSKGAGPGENAARVGMFEGDIHGKWTSPCLDAKEAGLGEVSTLTFSDNAFTRIAQVGASGRCNSSYFEATFGGSFETGADLADGVTALDLTTTSARVRPTTDQGARILSLAKTCGIGNWKTGVENDVLSRLGKPGCFERYPRNAYTSFNVKSGALALGEGDGFATPSRRPLKVDRAHLYAR